ncbi:hypothetical protein BpHYR1_020988 [Brachionus plicatilis]|uniref:Uncharacterized protein n=1 Tax=Brachionus plicatilis TaxID=10195 RepID=A0A3M7T1T3_BRAPC|nr:hypothetical protein BpHYR1_020988 [Brachionus plicatilis]
MMVNTAFYVKSKNLSLSNFCVWEKLIHAEKFKSSQKLYIILRTISNETITWKKIKSLILGKIKMEKINFDAFYEMVTNADDMLQFIEIHSKRNTWINYDLFYGIYNI